MISDHIKISVVILTLNAKSTIAQVLENINCSKYNVIVLDSSSNDKTIEICKQYNCKIRIIDRKDFNHGATRELARRITNSHIIVFLTQDAIPLNMNSIDELISPIINNEAHVAYARQIPKDKSPILEAFPREFNYPSSDELRSIKDVDKYGVKTFFCSDSCAAWSNSALDEIGGFSPTLTNEDYLTCAKLLLNGFKVAYVSKAIVYHSHSYSLKEEFQRMFDTGYVRAENPWIQDAVGNANKLGAKYFKVLINKLIKENPLLIPYAFAQTAMKFIGYKIGYRSTIFPRWFKKLCSGQKYYWDSKYYNG